ncbi:MAG: hypothetical protein GEU94_11260 [Micromonosporaceae bacterium]|nr:hypothetical protein [Micromonosporaceae bacterium]
MGDAEEWQETGKWRRHGITHWYLVAEQNSHGDSKRFAADRIAEVAANPDAVAWTPREAAEWMRARSAEVVVARGAPDDRQLESTEGRDWWAELRFRTLDRGESAAGGITLGEGRSVDIWARASNGHCHRR